jgi:hypothetical protein
MFVEIELLRPHPSGVRCSPLALSKVNIDGPLHPAWGAHRTRRVLYKHSTPGGS